nr:RNA-directed DNA polymerase, eukaryota, nucleotide-binding alpha-beta plait domain protein [Tanacetum cinerariifolium]
MESSTSSQPNQLYSPINPTNLDMNFDELIFSQDYNYSQDYSISHGSAPVQDDEDESPVEEVCNDYGTVVDVFIPNKKSKAGKRFASVRFIK